MSKKLLTFCFLFLMTASAWANKVVVDGATGTNSTYLPVALHTNTTNANFAFHSVSQQLYYASELAGASGTKITAISFDYVGTTFTRKIAVWLNGVDFDSFPLPNEEDLSDEANKTPNMVNPGTKVFSGDVDMVDHDSYTITFDEPFVWDGTSNIVVTILDSTALKNSKTFYPDATIYTVQVRIFETSGKVRFLHKTSKDEADYNNKGWDMNNLTAAKANTSSVANRKYANRITFSFEDAVKVPAIPDDLTVSDITSSSATLAWSAVEGAKSYDLQQSEDGSDWSALASGETGTSFDWTGLEAESTRFVRIRANNDAGSSDWSDAVKVTTDAVFEYKGITFDKWTSTNSLPTEGNYYLNEDVVFGWEASDLILSGNLNLCLNGKTANIFFLKIVVPSGKTFEIFDNLGSGKITGFVNSEVGFIDATSLIVVESGGTLVLKEGAIENTYDPDSDGSSYAIYSNGDLILAGAPVISSKAVDIFLSAMSVITLDGPITNSEKYTLNKVAGSIVTSGWSTQMGDAKPSDFFVHADEAKSFDIKDGEVNIVKKDDEPTAIENQMANGKCENVKMIKDGQLLILRDGKTYNVIGQQIR